MSGEQVETTYDYSGAKHQELLELFNFLRQEEVKGNTPQSVYIQAQRILVTQTADYSPEELLIKLKEWYKNHTEINTEQHRNGWEDATEKHSDSLKAFLRYYLSKLDITQSYDPLTEIHVSGQNSEVLSQIRLGQTDPNDIQFFYNSEGDLEQIHAVFNSQGNGQSIDVYLSKRGLKDYLAYTQITQEEV